MILNVVIVLFLIK